MGAVKKLKMDGSPLFVSHVWLGSPYALADRQRKYEKALEDVILQYTYPRIDAEVSKHRNHLLKAPFCIHPSTGRVCVPVNPSLVDDFNPATVPTVGDLLHELNSMPSDASEGRKVEGGFRMIVDPDSQTTSIHRSSRMWRCSRST